MNNLEYLDQIEHNLNSAFSMNYVMLQTIEKLKGTFSQTEQDSSLFGMLRSKSEQRDYYNDNLDSFAEARNQCFAEIKAFFDASQFFSAFSQNATALINVYNKKTTKNISYSDIFSEREIKNWKSFYEILEHVNSITESSDFNSMSLVVTMANFLLFYDQYKVWLASFEIFETLENDITKEGSKSLHYGKPKNPNVKVMTVDEFRDIASKFIAIRDGALKEKIKSLNTKKKELSEAENFENSAISILNQLFNKLQDRFAFTNTHLMELGGLWSKLKFKLTPYSNNPLQIYQTYVHNNELLSLSSAMSLFPELDGLSQEIMLKFSPENADLFQSAQKENT